jgi:hypothetical protein
MATVGITVSLTVDLDRWADEYGLEARARDVRADLLAYVTTALDSTPVPIEVTRR